MRKPGNMKAALSTAAALAVCGSVQAAFRTPPYVQRPDTNGVTLVWFSEKARPGRVTCRGPGGELAAELASQPEAAPELACGAEEISRFAAGAAPEPPYRHEVTVSGLLPATTYDYEVTQGTASARSAFRTAPAGRARVRFAVFADSETEPESDGRAVRWDAAGDPGAKRHYLVDQSVGFSNNLAVLRAWEPELVVIAGDLVESGGEQRDWDEFWRHLGGPAPGRGLAASVALLPCLGNHEYYAGPGQGRYSQPASEAAVRKYKSYFSLPRNGSVEPEHEERYYAFRYGPVTLIVLDLNNGLPERSSRDSNFFLEGSGTPGGGCAPDFNPGSEQYLWLERQLRSAQESTAFTFVVCHVTPYSSGPHGLPAGLGEGLDGLSGVPARVLTPLFLRYGVDAVFCGHDEMYERSELRGKELLPDGAGREHVVHVYDIGIGGDGLRVPHRGVENPRRQFLAYADAPEKWEHGRLVSGGRHYGHLQVEVSPENEPDAGWRAVLTPVYVLPLLEPGTGSCTGVQSEAYHDVVVLRGSVAGR